MERKKFVIKHMLRRFLLPGICIMFLICAFALPAGAVSYIDYNDYLTNIVVDGDNDIVTVTIPGNISFSEFFVDDLTNADSEYQLITSSENGRIDYEFTDVTNKRFMYRMYPFGVYFGDDGYQLDVTNIPNNTTFTFNFTIGGTKYYAYNTPKPSVSYIFYDSAGNYLGSSTQYLDNTPLDETFSLTGTLVKPDGAVSLVLYCNLWEFSPLEVPAPFYFVSRDTVMTMSISSLYRLQLESGKTNTILKEVEKQLADQGKTLDEVLDAQQTTNNKLDGLWGSITEGFSSMGDKLNDLFTGGSAGDKVSGSADDFKNQLGDVEDFQSGIESDLEAGFDEVLDFSGLASLAPAFAFIGKYVNKIWYDMDGLQIVFVLAFGIGAFLQLAQHTPRVPVLRSQDRSSRGTGGRNSNWYDPVSGRVVDGNRERGQARARRGS